MRTLVTPDEMAAADKAAVDSGTPVEVLMERAGRAVARTAIRMLGGRYGHNVVVVCGKGNNGGDGYAAARILRREGVGVRCMAVADPSELSGAALAHHEAAVRAGVRVGPFTDIGDDCDLIVDAIYGTGLKPRPEGVPDGVARAIEHLRSNKSGALVLSVDVPSGISGELGPIMAPVRADVTITFAAEKVGTFLAPPGLSGQVEVADIGIEVSGAVGVLERRDVEELVPRRAARSHKRSSGSVLVIAGSDAMPGAAALVTRGAMRSGCGYVTVACTEKTGALVNELCPEALVRVVTDAAHLGPEIVTELDDVIAKTTAVAVGPGLGTGAEQSALVKEVLSRIDVPLAVDADGLNALAGQIDRLADRTRPTVITPHPVELARLMGVDVKELDDRIGSARAAATRAACTVLSKGFRTVVAGPGDDRVNAMDTYVNPTGGPELATAGTGDVLTGIVAAFVAAGSHHSYTRVAAAAAYVHGLAGASVAERAGGHGVVAWDVAEAIPDALSLFDGGLS